MGLEGLVSKHRDSNYRSGRFDAVLGIFPDPRRGHASSASSLA